MLCRTLPLILAFTLTACGVSSSPTATSTPTPDVQASNRRDTEIERQLRLRTKAAAEGDATAVAAAEQALDRLAAQAPPAVRGRSQDPFFRAVEEFAFKRAPLYVQQIVSGADHRLFARVNEDAFCLLAKGAREKAVTTVYTPMEARLRAAGVTDFVFVLTSLSAATPKERDALAIGEGGQVRLTPDGEAC